MNKNSVFDVFDLPYAQELLKDIADKQVDNNVGDKIEGAIISMLTSHYTHLSNFVGSAFAKIQDAYAKRLLSQYLSDQVNYLTYSPEDLERQVSFITKVSSLFLVKAFYTNNEMNVIQNIGRLILNSVANMSLTEGLDVVAKDQLEKDVKLKWYILRYPLCLVLNQYLVNKKCNKHEAEDIIRDIINVGTEALDYKDLCFITSPPLIKSPLINTDISDLKSFYEFHKNVFSNMDDIISGIEGVTWFFEKLNKEHFKFH